MSSLLLGRQQVSRACESIGVELAVCALDPGKLKLTLYIMNVRFFLHSRKVGRVLLMTAVPIKHYIFRFSLNMRPRGGLTQPQSDYCFVDRMSGCINCANRARNVVRFRWAWKALNGASLGHNPVAALFCVLCRRSKMFGHWQHLCAMGSLSLWNDVAWAAVSRQLREESSRNQQVLQTARMWEWEIQAQLS